MDPRIGVLVRDGMTYYYAYLELSIADQYIVMMSGHIYVESTDLGEVKAYIKAHDAQPRS